MGEVHREAYMRPQSGRRGRHGQSRLICDVPGPQCNRGDLNVYCELVQSGQFYDFLLAELRIGTCPNLTREDLKKKFLADVVAKRKVNRRGAEYPGDVEDTFQELFAPEFIRYRITLFLRRWTLLQSNRLGIRLVLKENEKF